MFDSVKDSGQRQNFETGSRRDTREGKGRFDLVSPIVEQRDARHLENGAKKYGDRNWELGQPISRFLDSAKRHLSKYQEGLRDEDHLAAARWNLACIIHVEEMIRRGRLPEALNDLPSYLPVAAPTEPKEDPRVSTVQYFNDNSTSAGYWRRHPDGTNDFVTSSGSVETAFFGNNDPIGCGLREVSRSECNPEIAEDKRL